eukprot:CAMPEP_0205956402 /NCGR_PEP_ID=MMETSP1459-20131121/37731_1 /ASSEMBLY_ACC=CAM_ASM_001120 /TAXON_ID=41880 /ORGANISM="Pycnococcus provasolii, Strain RCC931" /LENGTH=154 /DNA_ID=CAMNT_0053328809 /DNA_START=85 /DNA_END=545 /DNA_ORIENTATION=+
MSVWGGNPGSSWAQAADEEPALEPVADNDDFPSMGGAPAAAPTSSPWGKKAPSAEDVTSGGGGGGPEELFPSLSEAAHVKVSKKKQKAKTTVSLGAFQAMSDKRPSYKPGDLTSSSRSSEMRQKMEDQRLMMSLPTAPRLDRPEGDDEYGGRGG